MPALLCQSTCTNAFLVCGVCSVESDTLRSEMSERKKKCRIRKVLFDLSSASSSPRGERESRPGLNISRNVIN